MNDNDDVEMILAARSADLPGGLHVLRALPQARRRMVGPFVFLDQMGPATFSPGSGIAVGRHPHIGLSTVTYLFEGEAVHRDSLGSVQRITPGAVNWMTAGRGIAHSERGTPESMAKGGKLSGIQIWVALPQQFEEQEPSFVHHPADTLPEGEEAGVRWKVVAGAWYGVRSPVKTHSELFYVVTQLESGSVLRVAADCEERAAYVVEGALELGTGVLRPGELAVFRRGSEVLLRACEDSRVLVFGGEPLDGPRHIYWNFVSSSKERIEQAKADWRAQRFAGIEGEPDYIPLPGDPVPTVNYP
ncbi:MAG: pirin family protein [Myxococcaceae bacterium]